MAEVPDYNKDHPASLLAEGRCRGRAIGIDVSTIRPAPRLHDLFLAELQASTQSIAGDDTRVVAVKVIADDQSRQPRNGRREASILAAMSHPNVLPLLNAYLDPSTATNPRSRVTIFTPFYPYSLRSVLDSPGFAPGGRCTSTFHALTEQITIDLLSAVSYLHENRVAHRDINPSNVVLDGRGRAVLIDFGIAIRPADEVEGSMHFEVGTGPYRAPELIFASRSYDAFALDLWALGATLAELFRPLASPSPPSSAGSDDDDGPWSRVEVGPQRTRACDGDEVKRKPLFESGSSDFVLAASIFKVIGTPTLETWPEAVTLSFTKFNFVPFPPTPIASHLPHLDPSSPLLSVISSMLVCSAAERMPARQGLEQVRREGRGHGPDDFAEYLSTSVS
ncbi:hypothetical protein JCM10212_005039 [Sporobolomyces blumeae]